GAACEEPAAGGCRDPGRRRKAADPQHSICQWKRIGSTANGRAGHGGERWRESESITGDEPDLFGPARHGHGPESAKVRRRRAPAVFERPAAARYLGRSI